MSVKLLISILATPLFILAFQGTVQSVDLFKNNCGGEAASSAICKDSAELALKDSNKNEDNPIYGPNGIITSVTNILTAIVAIGAVISIVYAGIKLIFSGSNPQEANSARERIIYACIALVFVALAQIIVRFIINRL